MQQEQEAVYLAHSATEQHPEGQRLSEHLQHTAELAEKAASKFGAASHGFYTGILHDKGKYTAAFQKRIRGANTKSDHATAGAIEAYNHRLAPEAFAIAGHHAGLPDIGGKFDIGETLQGRLSKTYQATLENSDAFYQDVVMQEPPQPCALLPKEGFFYTHMLFSCLVDADWKDTNAYFSGTEQKQSHATLKELSDRLQRYFEQLDQAPSAQKELNCLRRKIRDAAQNHADKPNGIFTLTVPTGGGKTLTSMVFALRHAIENDLDRVIYVIPYCSILEQTGRIFSDIFGSENVREHYSTAEFTQRESNEQGAFLSECWDEPIILTTAVQFFESVYSNRPSQSRKLHHICRSVLIFDEAQMLPVPVIKPCVLAISQMVKQFQCTAVLCTATQPALEQLVEQELPGCHITELCPDVQGATEQLKRVTFRWTGHMTDEELTECLSKEKQVLCVVNNRKQAQRIYETLDDAFCLTTLLTPHDRRIAIDVIRKCLAAGEPCRVVSTSLIEAGVDLDFPCVWRALAGFDSIVQAGGRCNREGKHPASESITYIFEPDAVSPIQLRQSIEAARRTLQIHGDDLTAQESIRDYFLFWRNTLVGEEGQDEKNILADIGKLNFRTVAENFHMIANQNDRILYIPYDGGKEAVEALRENPTRATYRQAARYAITIRKNELDELITMGKAVRFLENSGILCDSQCYNSKTGFILREDSQAFFQ